MPPLRAAGLKVVRDRDVLRDTYCTQVPRNVRIGYAAQYLVLVGFLSITTTNCIPMLGVIFDAQSHGKTNDLTSVRSPVRRMGTRKICFFSSGVPS